MGWYDYFEKVREPGRIISHLENLIKENITIIDTNVLPSLEPHLKKLGKKDEGLINSHNAFMVSFSGWLKNYPAFLVLVPSVREEIQQRLEANGYYTRESLKTKNPLPALKEYETLADQSLEEMKRLPSFEPPPLYDENLALLEYLHTVMQWQKEEHKAGNADDQIVSAALAIAAVKSVPINVITFDTYLQSTLLHFHKIITCRQITAGHDQKPYVSALRKAKIIVRGFNPDSCLVEFRGSTNQFRAPYSYPFEKEMKQIGRIGFKDAARAYNREKERVKRNIEEYLFTCHERFLAPQREKVNPPIPQKKAVREEPPTPSPLLKSLESLLSLIPPEPETEEEISKAREGYLSLKNISEQQGLKDFQKIIEERLSSLETRGKHVKKGEVERNIASRKNGLVELVQGLNDEDSTEKLILVGTELKSLYQQLKQLE